MEDLLEHFFGDNQPFDSDDSFELGDDSFDIDDIDCTEYHPSFKMASSDYDHEAVVRHSQNIVDDFEKLSKSKDLNEIQRLSEDISKEAFLRDCSQSQEYLDKQHELSCELQKLRDAQWILSKHSK